MVADDALLVLRGHKAMVWPKFELPDDPPALDEEITLRPEELEEITRLLDTLSAALESMPVVLSQAGQVIGASSETEDEAVQQIAQAADRLWRNSARHLSREIIRFEEEVVGGEETRSSFMLYSIHVAGGLVVTLGWQPTLSLTQIRAEAADFVDEVRHVLRL